MTIIRQPSVMSLLIQMRVKGQPLSTGTGFVCQSGVGPVLLTNRHNVTGRHNETGDCLSPTGGLPDSMVILHNQRAALGQWVSREESLFDNAGAPLWREHPTLGANADFIALPLTALNDVQLFPYDPRNPGPDMDVGPADSVSVIGFPFGLIGTGPLAVWATGFVASEPAIDRNALPVFLVDCRARPGQSGSPVIAYRSGGGVAMKDGSTAMFAGPVWCFLGIYSGRINTESDLGMIWKARAVGELLNAI